MPPWLCTCCSSVWNTFLPQIFPCPSAGPTHCTVIPSSRKPSQISNTGNMLFLCILVIFKGHVYHSIYTVLELSCELQGRTCTSFVALIPGTRLHCTFLFCLVNHEVLIFQNVKQWDDWASTSLNLERLWEADTLIDLHRLGNLSKK